MPIGPNSAGLKHVRISKSDNYVHEMRTLINDKKSSDVEFVIADGNTTKKFYGQKNIIAARSTAFAIIFANEFNRCHRQKSNKIIIEKISPISFYTLLEFIYSNSATLANKTTEQIIDIFKASVEYILYDLKNLCEAHILATLTDENTCDYMVTAVLYGSTNLQDHIVNYITSNAKAVLGSNKIEKIPEIAMISIISSDYLLLDELEVISIVRRWALNRTFGTTLTFPEAAVNVAKYIRLSLLSHDELAEVEKNNLQDPFIPPEIFSKNWKAIATGNVITEAPRRGTKKRIFESIVC